MTIGPAIIHLIRHGEVYNPQQILYGRLPRFALSARGLKQAMAAGRYLRSRPLRVLWTSPLLRARQTAEQIRQSNNQLTVRISGLINEVRTSFQGFPGAEIDTRNGDVYTGADAGSEQPEDIVIRARKFIGRMRAQYGGGEVAAVTHGDVVTFMVLWVKGVDVTAQNKIRLLAIGFPDAYPAHCSVTTLTYRSRDPHERPQIDYRRP